MGFWKKRIDVAFINPTFKFIDLIPVIKSIRSTWLVYGKNTLVLEENLATYLGVADVVATSSCTTALELALVLTDLKPGDEVITTPMSWVASTTSIIHHGGTPVFCDIDSSGLLDLDKVEILITSKTRAILFVDLYGQMPDVYRLRSIADKYNLVLIEDAAHALEAKYREASPGTISDFAAFSFHAAKNITSGQGGALAVRSKQVGELARILRRDGVVNLPDGRRRMLHLGYKFDSTDFQSAMLLKQLSRINTMQFKRKRVFDFYAENIDFRYCKAPVINVNARHANHLFVVIVDANARDHIRAYMKDHGVTTSIHYESIHMEPYFLENKILNSENLPESTLFGQGVISLPTYPQITRAQLKHVVSVLNNALVKFSNH
jgi:UDP-4-amino-4-deoxy-L-arabinose-oxoglutarate aminotransferase